MAQINAIGRRKTSTARVYLKPGKGEIRINNRPLVEFFPLLSHQNIITQPFRVSETEGKFDVNVNVRGGGFRRETDSCATGDSRNRLRETQI
jgi:small subunit ribosomal protein S9